MIRASLFVVMLPALLAAGAATAIAQAPGAQPGAASQPQQPSAAPQPGAKPGTQPAAPAPPSPPPPPAYSYDPEGRRDPFVSLLGAGVGTTPIGARPSGVSGLVINEVTVKGILRDKEGFIALVQGPDEKTYMLRTGAKVLDGSVKSIAQDRVVFSQDVNDPLSLVKQREVTKAVRQADGR